MRCSKCTVSLGGMPTSTQLHRARRAFLHRAGRLAGGLTLAACALTPLAAVPTQGPDLSPTVTIALAQPHSMAHLPLLLAQTLGYFRLEGVHVELVNHGTEERALQAVVRGQATVAACGYTSLFGLHARGGDMQSFSLLLRAPQVVVGASLKTLGHYRTPADLLGKRVGVLASAAHGHMVWGALLQSAGLRPSDVSLVATEGADELVARYRAGELDALCINDPLMALLEQRSEIRVLADTRSVHGTRELLGGPVPGGALCAPAPWLTAQSKTGQALTNGVVHALKWLQTAGPADLVKALPESVMGVDKVLYLAAFDKARGAFSSDGLVSPEAAQAAWQVNARLDPALLGARVSLNRTYTNLFASRAKTRFRA
jgi:NitT/TauT family transport system substrate-binding protein